MMKNKIPDLTIERLAFYSRRLEMLTENRTHIISSEKLAELCDVSAAQLRKDLAYFGEFGVRGVGYDAEELLKAIRRILATDRDWRLCIVGIGNLGNALLENENFKKRGYRFVAAFDSDSKKIGKMLPNGIVIEPPGKIKELTKILRIQMGVIAARRRRPSVSQICSLTPVSGPFFILRPCKSVHPKIVLWRMWISL